MSDYHPVVQAILRILDAAKIAYKTFEHEAVRTSEEAAALRPDYTLAQGAKALIIRIKRPNDTGETVQEFVQVVVPGDQKFNTKKVKAVLEAKDLRFASEEEVKELTGGVQPGGVPPFGNIFGLPVVVDVSLLEHEQIIFNAGDRRFSISMRSEDFQKVVKPIVAVVV